MTVAPLTEIWRGPFLESVHAGHAVICDGSGQIINAWGDPDIVMLPRSSCKMIQALPLITSGSADAAGLGSEHLALACASHIGAAIHTDRVAAWLAGLGLDEAALRCGPQMPDDRDARSGLIRSETAPCQIHNNCSGKHAGFVTLSRHLGAGPEYNDPAHPVQRACLAAFEEVTGQTSPGFGIDGCSAPNFATSLHGLARAMAWFATAADRSDGASQAAVRLVSAMAAHPELVAGEGRACTRLMRAMGNGAVVKTGAEAVYIAILPAQRIGIAVKIADGATRASQCTIAALLVRLGVLDPAHPEAMRLLDAPILSRNGIEAGRIRAVPGLTG